MWLTQERPFSSVRASGLNLSHSPVSGRVSSATLLEVRPFRSGDFSFSLQESAGFRRDWLRASFAEIPLGTQGGNFFRHCHIDELV
jgi:hypothetical protein